MLLPLETARTNLLARLERIEPVWTPLSDAPGGWAASEVPSKVQLPHFDCSAMDGYAVRSSDLANPPVRLVQVGTTAAGSAPGRCLEPGQCERIFTGAPLPPGADAVVMQEDTEASTDWPTCIRFDEAVRPWDNVRFRGEDIQTGSPIIHAGVRLGPQHLSILAACGETHVWMGRRPRVAILANGSELCEPGTVLGPGQIFESNRLALAGLVASVGGLPSLSDLVPDDLDHFQSNLGAALETADVVVTVGGASVGDADLAKAAVMGLGGKIEFWRLAIRPGKPFFFSRVQSKPVFGLPGNPVSAFVTAVLLVLPALRYLQGSTDCRPPECSGRLGETLTNPADRDHYARVHRNPQGEFQSSGLQGSHRLASLASATGLVCVPARATLPAGSAVPVLLW